MNTNLEDCQTFWKNVCQQTSLIKQLMDFGENPSPKDFDFELPQHGKFSINAKPAVPLGTNFMSDVFTAKAVTADGKKYSGFVKVLPSNPSRVAAAFIGGSYQREFAVYQEWIPELKKIKLELGLKDSDIPLNVAQPYFVNLSLTEDKNSFETDTVYVLEELKSKGYRMNTLATTHEGIDYDHASAAMKTYANYHALSIAYLRKLKNPDGTLNLSPSCQIFRKDPNYISPAHVYGTIVLPSYSKILRHFHEDKTADWLDSFLPKLDEVWNFDSFMCDNHPLACLIHGDSWSNNILFRYADDKSNIPLDMLLIDWQIARCGHPSMDLGYFLFSSTSSTFRHQYLNRLLIEYFITLKAALAKLGIDLEEEGFNQDTFLVDTKKRFVLSLFIALFIMPILLDASKAVEHTLKDQDISKDLITAAETEDDAAGDAAKLDEEGTKAGWESLFELKTVAANPLLSRRVVELIRDIKSMAL